VPAMALYRGAMAASKGSYTDRLRASGGFLAK